MSPWESLFASRSPRKRSLITIFASSLCPPLLALFRFHKAHRNTDDPPHNVRIARIGKPANFAFRVRMRDGGEIPFAHLAPAADIFAAQLDEINGPFVFVLPFGLQDFLLLLIDLHDGARPDDGVHGSIRHSHKAVHAISQVEVLDQAEGNLSPNLPEPRQQVGPVKPQVLARFHRHYKGVIRIRRTEGQLRLAGCEQSLVAPEVAQIAAEERENVRPVNMIDRAKRIQLENAGLVDSVLDVVEPSPRDEEILILPLVREPSAVRFHFTEGQAETLP